MNVVLSEHLPLLSTGTNGIQKLRGLILELAVCGKLVPQDPNDEPASELLKRIAEERAGLEAEGGWKKTKAMPLVGEDEQPFNLPDSWAWARFADVTSYIQRGKGPDYADKSDYMVVSQKCVRWHGLDLSQVRWITPESFSKYDSIRLLRTGDVLWNSTGTGTIGRAVVVPNLGIEQVLVADSHVTVMRPVLISPTYLWRWIQSPTVQSEIEGSASGSTNQIELATSTVTAHPLPLPPLAEQHRIVAKVNELMTLCDRLEADQADAEFAHIKLVETLLSTLAKSVDAADLAVNWQRIAEQFDTLFTTASSIDALKQTILQLAVIGKLAPQDANDEPASELLKRITDDRKENFPATGGRRSEALPDEDHLFSLPSGWAWTQSETVANFIDPHPSHRTPPEFDGGIPYIGYAEIDHDRGIDLKAARKVSPNVFEEHRKRYCLKSGDFVFGKIGTLGKPFFLSEPFNYCLSANLILVQPDSFIINPKFLAIFLDSPSFIKVMGDEKTNSTHGVFGIKKARSICLPLPPLGEQHRIVAKVEELMALCERLKAELAESRIRQQGLATALIENVLEAA